MYWTVQVGALLCTAFAYAKALICTALLGTLFLTAFAIAKALLNNAENNAFISSNALYCPIRDNTPYGAVQNIAIAKAVVN